MRRGLCRFQHGWRCRYFAKLTDLTARSARLERKIFAECVAVLLQRKRLAVLAVADEAEAGGRRNRAGDPADTITMASQRDVCHLAFSIGCRGSSECAAWSK